MLPTKSGSIRLFQLAGIEVFLHPSWFIVALILIKTRSHAYTSMIWNALEYFAGFAIVLMHEFGHALACRQVGGEANRIILWPLGGVAYVAPPPRPGATLWSIAAGPLVNVLLLPFLTVIAAVATHGAMAGGDSDFTKFLQAVWFINLGLLIFNMLPIYPLDGGQILQALLWFVFGRAHSLMITAIIGFGGVAVLMAFVILGQFGNVTNRVWMAVVAAFILLNCWGGLMRARLLARVAKMPRRPGFACPACHQAPVLGALWRCSHCFKPFDTFESHARCPHCGTEFPRTQCFDCGNSRPIAEWVAAAPAVSNP
jgi:Zn-dependent protease